MPNMPDIKTLHGKDYQFGRLVPFVQIDEYYEEPKKKRKREKLEYWLPPYSRQSLYHFNKEGQLVSCHTQAQNAGQSWQEEMFCHYENLLLKELNFKANGHNYHTHLEEKRIYNEHNLLTEKCVWEGEHLKQRTDYRYDENLKLVCEENASYTRNYLYNNKGFCEEERIYCKDEHVKSFLYACDEQGRVVESWEESPKGQTCRVHKYQYNQHQSLFRYQLINQDGLLLKNLEYQYDNFVEKDWLERYVWRLGGRAGRLTSQLAHSCLRSPCLEQRAKEELEQRFSVSRKSLKLPEGNYQGQTRVGLMHGYGRLNFFDGSYYIGHFEAGCMDGYGSFYWPDGRSYRGYFANNRMQGRGNYYQADGSLYCGVFEEGKLLSSKPHYYLSADSPLSRENRKAENLRTYAKAENTHAGTKPIDKLKDELRANTNPEAPTKQEESTYLENPLLSQSHTAKNSTEPDEKESNIVSTVYGEQQDESMTDNLNGRVDWSANLNENGRTARPTDSRSLTVHNDSEFIEHAKRVVRQEHLNEAAKDTNDWEALYTEANVAMHYLNEEHMKDKFVAESFNVSEDANQDKSETVIKALLEPISEESSEFSMQAIAVQNDPSEAIIHHLLNQEDWEVSPAELDGTGGHELQKEFAMYLHQDFGQKHMQETMESKEAARLWATPPIDKKEILRKKETKWP